MTQNAEIFLNGKTVFGNVLIALNRRCGGTVKNCSAHPLSQIN